MVVSLSGYSPREVYEVECAKFNCKKNSAICNFLSERPDDFKSISVIDLSKNFVGPKGVLPLLEVVRLCENLELLNLCGQQLDKNAIDALCLVLRSHPTVIHLNLSANPLSMSAGTSLLLLAKDNPLIQHINLTDSFIKPSVLLAINAQLERNREYRGKEADRADIISNVQRNEKLNGGDVRIPLQTSQERGEVLSMPMQPIVQDQNVTSRETDDQAYDSLYPHDLGALLASFTHEVHDVLFDEDPTSYVAKYCSVRRTCFHDADFRADRVPLRRGVRRWDAFAWRRVSKLFPSATLLPEAGEDKTLVFPRECFQAYSWVFTCVEAVFKDAAILRDTLFTSYDVDHGVYGIRVYVDGRWRYVIVDDYLPVNEKNELMFTKPVDNKYFWPCILEKALAKMYGGYLALDIEFILESVPRALSMTPEATTPTNTPLLASNGFPNTVECRDDDVRRTSCAKTLQDLSGGVGITRFLRTAEFQKDEWWASMLDMSRSGAIMVGITDFENALPGIETAHAYRITHVQQVGGIKLVMLSSQWSPQQWKGDWSDDSCLWQSHRDVSMTLRKKRLAGDHFGFWMSYNDFLSVFIQVHICHVFNGFTQHVVECEWGRDTAGGPCFDHHWHLNPHFKLRLSENTLFFINLSLPDTRFAPTCVKAMGMHILNSPRYPVCYLHNTQDCVVATDYVETDSISVEGNFTKEGVYWIVPSADLTGVMSRFILRMFVSSPFVFSSEVIGNHWNTLKFSDIIECSGEFCAGDDNAQVLIRFLTNDKIREEVSVGPIVVKVATPEDKNLAIGLFLVHSSFAGSKASRTLGVVDKGDIVASSPYAVTDRAYIMADVCDNDVYTLITCISPTGSRAEIEYTLWSAIPSPQHTILPVWGRKSVTVSWPEGSGSFYGVKNNPQIEICPERDFDTFVIKMNLVECNVTDPAIVLFVLQNAGNKGDGIKGKIPANQVLKRSQYVRHHFVQCELQLLEPTDSLLVIPCLQPTGSKGACAITVSTETSDFSVRVLSSV